MTKIFQEPFLKDFWDESDYTYRDYTGPAITKEQIQQAEETLGYKLPQSYIELLENKNGGVPKNTRFPTTKKTCWAKDHVAISGVWGINDHKLSLLGEMGSQFMKEEWGFPNLGIVICDTPGGEDAIMLDYRKCKKGGEPSVVHVDIISGKPKITAIAPSFEALVRGLAHESLYVTPKEVEKAKQLEKVRSGDFSPVLAKAIGIFGVNNPDLDIEKTLRNQAERIVEQKNSFLLHDDDLSLVMFDYLFLLFSCVKTPKSMEEYCNSPKHSTYEDPYFALLVSLPATDEPYYGFNDGGYCASFARNWWMKRWMKDELVDNGNGFIFTKEATARVFAQIEPRSK